jgi:hypothetical protein
MVYRHDFYDVQNIYGYSGDIERNPTVYFLSATEHGRITQDHHNSANIGRDVVKRNEGYTFWDELDDKGKLRTVEQEKFVGYEEFGEHNVFNKVHRSRNVLVLLSDTTDAEARANLRSLLSQSIWRYTELKENRRRNSLPPLSKPDWD